MCLHSGKYRQIVGNTGEEGIKYRKETEEEASAEEGSKAQKVNMRVEEVEEVEVA